MAFIDYYKILGVSKDIPQKDIRLAYKKRAKQFHPDLHPDDPKAKAKFQALNEAFDVLNDPEKRKKYDQYGEHWKQADMFGAGGFGEGAQYSAGGGFEGFDFSQFGNGDGFSSFFNDLFGGGRTQRRTAGSARRSGMKKDRHATINLDLYTAMLGGDILVKVNQSKFKIHVRPETQNGSQIRMKGKGFDLGNGVCGDLIITYNVQLPVGLNEKQKELLRQMQQLSK